MKELLINELLNKEMTLLEMDNEVQIITGTKDSAFSSESEDCIYYNSMSYWIEEIEDCITINWSVIKITDDANKFEMTIKIESIE